MYVITNLREVVAHLQECLWWRNLQFEVSLPECLDKLTKRSLLQPCRVTGDKLVVESDDYANGIRIHTNKYVLPGHRNTCIKFVRAQTYS